MPSGFFEGAVKRKIEENDPVLPPQFQELLDDIESLGELILIHNKIVAEEQKSKRSPSIINFTQLELFEDDNGFLSSIQNLALPSMSAKLYREVKGSTRQRGGIISIFYTTLAYFFFRKLELCMDMLISAGKEKETYRCPQQENPHVYISRQFIQDIIFNAYQKIYYSLRKTPPQPLQPIFTPPFTMAGKQDLPISQKFYEYCKNEVFDCNGDASITARAFMQELWKHYEGNSNQLTKKAKLEDLLPTPTL